MTYNVTFIRYHNYEVEATSEDEAEKLAYEQFRSQMMYPIADTTYDEIEINEREEKTDENW